MSKVLVFDGSYFLTRFSSSSRTLYNSDGLDIYPLYYTLKLIADNILRYQPEEVYFVIDIGRDVKKKEKLKEYKEKRIPVSNKNVYSYLNEDKYQRLSLARYILATELSDALPVKFVPIPLVEGDTIVYYIAERKVKEGKEVIVFSGDKDLLQIVDEKISLSLSTQSKREAFYELLTLKDYQYIWSKIDIYVPDDKFFHPNNISYYRALIGDASDNIKGIQGLGKMTVSKFVDVAIKEGIEKFETPLEFIEFYENIYKDNKYKNLHKKLKLLLDNIETWLNIYEIVDLKHAANNELVGTKVVQIEEHLNKEVRFDISKIMEIFTKFDINSTDNYKEWLLAFEALYKNDYSIFDSKIKGYYSVMNLLNNFYNTVESVARLK